MFAANPRRTDHAGRAAQRRVRTSAVANRVPVAGVDDPDPAGRRTVVHEQVDTEAPARGPSGTRSRPGRGAAGRAGRRAPPRPWRRTPRCSRGPAGRSRRTAPTTGPDGRRRRHRRGMAEPDPHASAPGPPRCVEVPEVLAERDGPTRVDVDGAPRATPTSIRPPRHPRSTPGARPTGSRYPSTRSSAREAPGSGASVSTSTTMRRTTHASVVLEPGIGRVVARHVLEVPRDSIEPEAPAGAQIAEPGAAGPDEGPPVRRPGNELFFLVSGEIGGRDGHPDTLRAGSLRTLILRTFSRKSIDELPSTWLRGRRRAPVDPTANAIPHHGDTDP